MSDRQRYFVQRIELFRYYAIQTCEVQVGHSISAACGFQLMFHTTKLNNRAGQNSFLFTRQIRIERLNRRRQPPRIRVPIRTEFPGPGAVKPLDSSITEIAEENALIVFTLDGCNFAGSAACWAATAAVFVRINVRIVTTKPTTVAGNERTHAALEHLSNTKTRVFGLGLRSKHVGCYSERK